MAKNKQSNLIASVKMLNIGFIYKYIINLERGVFSIRNLPITISNVFPLDPPPSNYFSKHKLLRVSFIELYDFITYQHVNKRTKILPLATSHIYATSLFIFALPISMPRFKRIIYYQNIPKLGSFCKKKAKYFVCWGLRPQTPVSSGADSFASRSPASGSFAPRPPKQPLNCEFLVSRLVFLLLLCYFVWTDFAARWCLWFSANDSFFEQVCQPVLLKRGHQNQTFCHWR